MGERPPLGGPPLPDGDERDRVRPAAVPSRSADTAQGSDPAQAPPTAASAPLPMPVDTTGWVAMLDRMGIRAVVRQLADNCSVLGEKDGALWLGLRREHELLLSDMARRQIEQGLSAVMGAPTRVRIDIVADPTGGDSGIDTPATRARQARDDRQQQAESDFAADANVQSALAALGGEIARGSIRPI